jgi:hypothetical protein
MSFLKRHPFPVAARFGKVVALSFAFPEDLLRPLLPAGLELDAYEGMGFVTVAMVWTQGLRPAFLPAPCGQSFFLAGYRIFSRLRDGDGRRLRGLKILRSETDKRRMVTLGNLMTGYRYRLVELDSSQDAAGFHVRTRLPSGPVTLEVTFQPEDDAPLPQGSPFPDWRTARRFAGPMPFTFSPEKDGSFTVIEGGRDGWTPRPVRVIDWRVGLFDEEPFAGSTPVLANAFTVEEVDYRWERGRNVRPGGGP